MIYEPRLARTSLVVLSFLALTVHSFIPATPSNQTDSTPNVQEDGTINAFWFPDGQFGTDLALVVGATSSEGIASGALVHFTDSSSKIATKTPWIALVFCDANATNPSQDDIFVHAKSVGAVAALLYSHFSEKCVINPEYKNKDLDIFAFTRHQNSLLLESLFQNIDANRFGSFDPQTLDSKSANVTTFQESGYKVDPGYIFVDLVAKRPTFSSIYTTLPSGTGPPTATGSSDTATSGTASPSATDANANSTNGNGAIGTASPTMLVNVVSACLLSYFCLISV